MPVEVIGVADRKIRGRLQTESPIEKFGMKPHYYIGLDLGQAACSSPLRTRRMSLERSGG